MASEFEPVLDAFIANFEARAEVGAAVCVYLDGEPVVDLWGGVADTTTGRPWQSDTVVPVFSSSKGVTAVGANLLIERGQLDPDATVATYWPEFAANGKDAITVRQTLSHQAGLPLVDGDFTLDDVCAWDPIVEQIARQEPMWEPGTKHGYHMKTYGWINGEIIRRITEVSPGQFLRTQVSDPLGIDFWVGLPEAVEPRVARLETPKVDMRALLEPMKEKLLLAACSATPPTCSAMTTCGTRARCTRARCRPRTASATHVRSLVCTRRASPRASTASELSMTRRSNRRAPNRSEVRTPSSSSRVRTASASCSGTRSAPPTRRTCSATPAPVDHSRSPTRRPASRSATS